SLVHHNAVATPTTTTAITATAVRSQRVRRSGAGIRPDWSACGARLVAVFRTGDGTAKAGVCATRAACAPASSPGPQPRVTVVTRVLRRGGRFGTSLHHLAAARAAT